MLKEMIKPILIVVVLFFALSLTGGAIAGGLQKIGKLEGYVDIVAWPGYIEKGDTDPNYDWVTAFEKQCDCKVRVKTAGTSDEMVALMNEGGFDLVTASGDASLRLIAGKRVQEVNTELIPSWDQIDPRLQNAPWHTVDGKHYGVPYQFRSTISPMKALLRHLPGLSKSTSCGPKNSQLQVWCRSKAQPAGPIRP